MVEEGTLVGGVETMEQAVSTTPPVQQVSKI